MNADAKSFLVDFEGACARGYFDSLFVREIFHIIFHDLQIEEDRAHMF